ncbi:MAG: YfiR family protein [Thermodesulfobacteriota bacterium]
MNGWPVSAQETKPTQYQVKAAFIYNFLQFIDLPLRPNQGMNLTLFILGEDPFGNAFDPFQGEKILGRKWNIRPIRYGQDFKDGHILFIAASEKGRINQIVKQAHTQGLVTIGDTDGFGQQGVMINLFLERNRVRFEINMDSVRNNRILISSHLLKLARIISKNP